MVKGVLHPEDARACVAAGAAAVWVSNHGGRQLDGVAATADRLARWPLPSPGTPRCTSTAGCAPRREALVALALGASAVFLGRQPLYALAVDGAAGVSRLLAELAADLEEGLRLLGCGGVGQLGADQVQGPTHPL